MCKEYKKIREISFDYYSRCKFDPHCLVTHGALFRPFTVSPVLPDFPVRPAF
jgi:hypothetical protein